MAEVKKLPDGTYSAASPTSRAICRASGSATRSSSRKRDISDWMFMRNGKIVGGETIKPLLEIACRRPTPTPGARMEPP